MPNSDDHSWRDALANLTLPFRVIDSLTIGLLAVAIVLAALIGPVYLAKDFFGDWLSAGVILSGTIWLSLVVWFAISLRRGRASIGDAFLFVLVTICYLVVAFKLLAEARAAA